MFLQNHAFEIVSHLNINSVRLFALSAMDPNDMYRKVLYKYILFYGRCTGHHIADRTFKPNIITYISHLFWNSAILLALYTLATGVREMALTNLFFTLLGTQVFR